MIPTFPEFKLIELDDMEEVDRATSGFAPYSDFNFISMWSWNLVDEIAISKLNDNLVVRFTDYVTCKPFLSFIGDKKINDTCEQLLDFAIKNNLSPSMHWVPEVCVKEIDLDKFEVHEDRDHFDYIYNIADLRDYPGNKFSKKRNHVSGFLKKFPNVEARTLSLKDKNVSDSVFKLFEKWQSNKFKEVDHELHDLSAMKRLLRGIEIFDLVVVGIFIEESLVAMFVNQLIDSEYSLAHMMKADLSVDDGLYAFLMKKNAEILSSLNIKFFNYEQDLGLENLRIAKGRFYPQKFLKKYTINYTHK